MEQLSSMFGWVLVDFHHAKGLVKESELLGVVLNGTQANHESYYSPGTK
jgi:hypothetical protein